MRIVWLVCLAATGLLPLRAVAAEPVKAISASASPTGAAESLFPELAGVPPVIQRVDFAAAENAGAATSVPIPPPLPPAVPDVAPIPYDSYGGYDEVVPPVMPAPVISTPLASPPCPHCGPHGDCRRCDPCCEPWYRLFDFGLHADPCGDAGIGQERVMLAPFFLGVSQPFTNVRVEYESVAGMGTPNRSEYLWAAPPKGPQVPETEVDYLDLRLVSELAPGDSFSITTSLPLRSLDPEVNPNTTGFGDMSVTTKLVLVDGRYWQFTQLLTTDINTGSARKGLGTGHVSLEPGILGRYEWNPRLYFHGRLAFWVPLGGDPDYSGPAVNYGLGASYVAYETDTFAVMPTFEMLGWTFLDGMKTLPNGYVAGVDGESSIAMLPGTRFVLGPAGDLGLFEVGLAGGLAFGDEGWYDSIFRTELRWSF